MIFGTKDRAAELRATLSTAEADLAAARASLGAAVADDDSAAASAARSEVSRLEQLRAELSAALPVAEARLRDAKDRETERQRRDQERALNKARKARIAAAQKVDAALLALGNAYDTYAALPTGGTEANAQRIARRAKWSLSAAIFRAAPGLAARLGIERLPRHHWRPLADSEASLVDEFPADV